MNRVSLGGEEKRCDNSEVKRIEESRRQFWMNECLISIRNSDTMGQAIVKAAYIISIYLNHTQRLLYWVSSVSIKIFSFFHSHSAFISLEYTHKFYQYFFCCFRSYSFCEKPKQIEESILRMVSAIEGYHTNNLCYTVHQKRNREK